MPVSKRVKLVAGMPPKVTDVALARFAPLRVTNVPPEIEPLAGEMLVKVGPDP